MKEDLKKKDTNMNVKFPNKDYKELQAIADELGGMSLSSMIRILVYSQLRKTRKTGDPQTFLDVGNDAKRK